MICQQIECSLKICSSAVYLILHDHLKLRKIWTRWVLHQLTNDQKQMRIQFCQKSLERCEQGRSQYILDIIAGDRTWFYHHNPKATGQSKMWGPKDNIRLTKVRRNKNSGKRMVPIFLMKSSLIKSIPLESAASISAH